MITRAISSFCFGFILFLLPDFLIFIGMKRNYIDFYHIKEYYNVFFVDNQNYIIVFLLSLFFGFLIMNKKSFKIFSYLYVMLIVLSLFSFYPTIGRGMAETLFMKKDLTFKLKNATFSGDILYEGRRYVYIYRKDLKKVIKLGRGEFSYSKSSEH